VIPAAATNPVPKRAIQFMAAFPPKPVFGTPGVTEEPVPVVLFIVPEELVDPVAPDDVDEELFMVPVELDEPVEFVRPLLVELLVEPVELVNPDDVFEVPDVPDISVRLTP